MKARLAIVAIGCFVLTAPLAGCIGEGTDRAEGTLRAAVVENQSVANLHPVADATEPPLDRAASVHDVLDRAERDRETGAAVAVRGERVEEVQTTLDRLPRYEPVRPLPAGHPPDDGYLVRRDTTVYYVSFAVNETG